MPLLLIVQYICKISLKRNLRMVDSHIEFKNKSLVLMPSVPDDF